MPNRCHLLPTIILTVLLSACGGNDGDPSAPGIPGVSTLMALSAEPAGINCAAGGSKIEAGLDVNGNGRLDPLEVRSTQYACNGTNGTNGTDGANGTNGITGPTGATGANGANALNWEVISGATSAKPDTGYIVASSETAQVVVTLPTDAELLVGDVVRMSGMGLGGWKIAQNPGQAVDTTGLGGMAGAIWTPRGPTAVWSSVASSADGSKLVAVAAGGTIWTSINGGVSWMPSGGPPEIAIGNWTSVASSADGSKLVAAAAGGTIWTSIDGGVSWMQSSGSAPKRMAFGNWTSLAPSADGSKLVRVAGLGGSVQPDTVWTSITGGAASVASSADGWKLVEVNSSGEIWIAPFGGTRGWTRTSAGAGTSPWTSVASSADGSKLVAVNVNPANAAGEIWTSADSGASWVQRSVGASTPPWTSVASSADGSRLVASAAVGQIYTSTDSGATWTAREADRFWTAVASSADGSRLVAVAGPTPGGGQIYVSTPTTTLGTLGTISGGASDAIELLYVGNGMFKVLSHEGNLTIQ